MSRRGQLKGWQFALICLAIGAVGLFFTYVVIDALATGEAMGRGARQVVSLADDPVTYGLFVLKDVAYAGFCFGLVAMGVRRRARKRSGRK